MIQASIISRLDAWLQRERPAYYKSLQKGLSEDQLAELEDLAGHRLPEGFKALYRWKNGQALSCFESFQYNFQFMNADSIKAAVTSLGELLDDGEFEMENWWSKGWLPFLDNGGGDHLCIDFKGTFTKKKGQILLFDHAMEYRPVQYPDFDTWLTVFVDSLDGGLWSYDKSGLQPTAAFKAFNAKRAKGYPKEFEAG